MDIVDRQKERVQVQKGEANTCSGVPKKERAQCRVVIAIRSKYKKNDTTQTKLTIGKL